MINQLSSVGLVVTITGNAIASESVHEITLTVQVTLNESIEVLENIESTIIDNNLDDFDQNFMTQLTDLQNTFRDVNASAETVVDRVHYYDGWRKAALFVGAIIPVVLVGLGLLFTLCGCRLPLGLFGWLCVFLSILVWASLGVHLASGKLISDICWEIDLSLENDEAGPLTILINCNKDDGLFGSMRVQLQEIIDDKIDEACTEINDLCSTSPALDCGSYTCTDGESALASKNITLDDAGTVRTIEECSTECTTPSLRTRTEEFMDSYNLFATYYRVGLQLMGYVDCQFVIDAFYVAKDAICDRFIFSLQQVFAGNALQGVGMTGAMIIMVHIFKGEL